MWRIKGEEEYHYILKCPFCGHEQEKKRSFPKKAIQAALRFLRKA